MSKADARMFLYRWQKRSDNRFNTLLHTGQALFVAGEVLFQFIQFAILGTSPEKICLDYVSRPYPELRRPFRVDSISNGNHDVKIVILQRSPDVSTAFNLNLGNSCPCCLPVKFSRLINVAYMLADDTAINSKHSCQLLHRQPNGFVRKPHIQCRSAYWRVNNRFTSHVSS